MLVLPPRSARKLLLVGCVILGVIAMFAYGSRSPSHLIPFPLLDLTQFEVAPDSDPDLVVVDIDILKCLSKSCKVPDGYRKCQPALNTLSGHISLKYNYYLIVKTENINRTTRILVDVDHGNDGEVVDVDGYRFNKRYIIVTPENPVPKDTTLIRDIDVLLGSNDLVDSRRHRQTVHLSSSEETHAALLVMRSTEAEHAAYLDYWAHWRAVQSSLVLQHTLDKFKVMQVSDLHFGTSLGKCRTPGECLSDFRTIKFIEKSLAAENPDLVVVTGDMFDIERTADYRLVILKALQPILRSGVKFIYTFGDELNMPSKLAHDTRRRIVQFLATLPQCLNLVDLDTDLHGLSNHNIVIELEIGSAMVTVLDSADHQLQDSQVNYLYRINKGNALFKLAFFHFPIPQFRPAGKFKIVGSYNEKHRLETASKAKFHDDFVDCGYNVVSVGHEHENDACILSGKGDSQMWLCYASVTGDSGDTRLDANFLRKVRMFEIDFGAKRLLSWKRNEVDNKAFDLQLIGEYASS